MSSIFSDQVAQKKVDRSQSILLRLPGVRERRRDSESGRMHIMHPLKALFQLDSNTDGVWLFDDVKQPWHLAFSLYALCPRSNNICPDFCP